jgi:hypothetical protein
MREKRKIDAVTVVIPFWKIEIGGDGPGKKQSRLEEGGKIGDSLHVDF